MMAESTAPEQAGTGQTVVKSADRALGILELLSRGRHRLSDIAESLHLPLSSVHGLLGTLVLRGFAEFDPTTRTYGLGLKAWTVGQGYTGHRDIVGIALPLMERLAQETGETIQLSRLDGTENVYIAIAESPQPMKLVSAVGMRLPAHAVGLGKALLSGLTEDELRRRYAGLELQRFTAHTVRELPELLAEIERSRQRGYAVDDEEYIIGCRCVAMPVRDHSGDVIAAMSVSAPTPPLRPGLGREDPRSAVGRRRQRRAAAPAVGRHAQATRHSVRGGGQSPGQAAFRVPRSGRLLPARGPSGEGLGMPPGSPGLGGAAGHSLPAVPGPAARRPSRDEGER